MEPMLPVEDGKTLANLTTEIPLEAGRLSGARIPPETRNGIERIVQQMNSYYSNLIEGHRTNPLDVEKALKKDFAKDPKKHALQQLGVAHVEVEQLIKRQLQVDLATDAYSPEFLRSIHREFYNRLPEEFRIVKYGDGKEYHLVPGEFRNFNVDVVRHIPPDHARLDAFMGRFQSVYASGQIASTRRLVAIAAAHQRLLWIHPFGDGNGRVVRLFSHAALMQSGLDGFGLWTLSRGLARYRDEYYAHLAMADQGRLSDFDGRGNLSAENLAKFCEFFLTTILDQIKFMSSVLEYDGLKHRIENYVYRNNVFGKRNDQGRHLLIEALHVGRYARGEATRLTGFKETIARELLQKALDEGLLESNGPRSPVYLGFPHKVLEDYFPKLFMPVI